MRISRVLITVLSAVSAVLLSALLFFVATEYKPDDIEQLTREFGISAPEKAPGGLRILSWNAGYFGLDSRMDFFMEGGTNTDRSPLENQRKALEAFAETVKKDEPDICFFQEIDRDSHRSFGIDQLYTLHSVLAGYETRFAFNFRSPFVPVPVKNPIGKVRSGISIMSAYAIDTAERHSLPGEYGWPVRIFHLKRCAIAANLESPIDGRDWYLINVHLSAYDDGGMRLKQLEYLKALITDLYAKGHYVVVGGDWNSLFPGLEKNSFGEYSTPEEYISWVKRIPEGWTPTDWQWCYDAEVPTSRSLEQPYRAGENFTCIIDGFLVSPNLRVDEVRGLDLRFEYSDHNPVTLTVSIRE